MRDNCISIFFNDTATTEIYTLSLHDALPIYALGTKCVGRAVPPLDTLTEKRPFRFLVERMLKLAEKTHPLSNRSEEHTSELQSRQYIVCRLLLEKKDSRSTNLTSPLHSLLSV